MNAAALPIAPGSVFGDGRLGACAGAIALVSLLAFETMAVAAAMPAIAGALGGFDLYALAFGGMLATSVLGMVLAGRSCDRRGPWRATAVGLTLFAAGLLLAGSATRMGWVVAGRIVQGLGGGMLGVTLYAGMGQLVPQTLHPRLFSLFATAWVLPGLLGPPLAAWLVVQAGWRSVFLVVAAAVPLAAALLLPAFGRLPLPASAEASSRAGALKFWAALGALGALLLHSASREAAPARSLAMLALGLAAATAAATRLLPRGSLRAAPGLPAVIALRGLLSAAFVCAEVFLPLYLTRHEGWSLARAGLALSAAAVMWSTGSAVQARIDDPRQRRIGLQAGFSIVAAGIALIAVQMALQLSAWVVVASWAVAGLGIGLSFPMLSVLTLARSTPEQRGANSSALQLGDALCSSAGLAVAGALFNRAGQGASLAGYLLVLGLALGLAVVGALLGRRAFT